MPNAGTAKLRASARAKGASKRSARTEEQDWQQLAVFGAGLALGIALGAATTLLSAPRSGAETRSLVRAYAGRKRQAVGERSRDAWLDLRGELRGLKNAWRQRHIAEGRHALLDELEG